MLTVTVDDSDTSQLVYHGTWFKAAALPNCMGTCHCPEHFNSNLVTVRDDNRGGHWCVPSAFAFCGKRITVTPGTAVMVYGTVAGATKGNTALSVVLADYLSPVRVMATAPSSLSYHEVLYRFARPPRRPPQALGHGSWRRQFHALARLR